MSIQSKIEAIIISIMENTTKRVCDAIGENAEIGEIRNDYAYRITTVISQNGVKLMIAADKARTATSINFKRSDVKVTFHTLGSQNYTFKVLKETGFVSDKAIEKAVAIFEEENRFAILENKQSANRAITKKALRQRVGTLPYFGGVDRSLYTCILVGGTLTISENSTHNEAMVKVEYCGEMGLVASDSVIPSRDWIEWSENMPSSTGIDLFIAIKNRAEAVK